MTAMQIEQIPIGNVLPYAANAKNHPDTQVSQLAASIKQFGFVTPVLVDAKGVLVAGHGRILAAKSLGMKKVPAIRLGHLSEAEIRALRIADNTISQNGSWSVELLNSELAALSEMNFDLEPLGLDSIDLPELPELHAPTPKAARNKTTIFLSVRNEDATKARKLVIAALDKAKMAHNL